jgi:hypothetical protein
MSVWVDVSLHPEGEHQLVALAPVMTLYGIPAIAKVSNFFGEMLFHLRKKPSVELIHSLCVAREKFKDVYCFAEGENR